MAPSVAGVVLASLEICSDRQRSSPLFRQRCDGCVQNPFVGDGGLLRLLENMQLDVTQEQRHHRSPPHDQAWLVLV